MAAANPVLLPARERAHVRHIIWPLGCRFPLISGDWQLYPDGRILAGYDADEFWRALVVAERVRVPDSYVAILTLKHKVETEFYALAVTAPDARQAASSQVVR